jgi:hypothetical protein
MSTRGAGPNVFEVERLAPECSHRVEVDTVDQYAVDCESHPLIFAVVAALLTRSLHFGPIGNTRFDRVSSSACAVGVRDMSSRAVRTTAPNPPGVGQVVARCG